MLLRTRIPLQPPLSNTTKAHVERALVDLPLIRRRGGQRGGQGVLVPGGFVVTAAHCLGWPLKVLDDFREPYVKEVQIVTASGRSISTCPIAVEPISDLAVLGPSDDNDEEARAFKKYCAATRPVHLALVDFKLPIPAYVFTHNKGGLAYTLTREDALPLELSTSGEWGLSRIEGEDFLDGGTSGSPVVTQDGTLLGVVTHATTPPSKRCRDKGLCWVTVARAHLAAPMRLVRQMTAPAVAVLS